MADNNDTYSLPIGLTFLFNLLLGTGVLTMPLVFAQAGYVTGIVVIGLLCFMSFIQVTFLVEAMANANFVHRTLEVLNVAPSDSEDAALLLNASDQEDNVEADVAIRGDRRRPSNEPTDQMSSLLGLNNPTVQVQSSTEEKAGITNEAFQDDVDTIEVHVAPRNGYGTTGEESFSLRRLAMQNVFSIKDKQELGNMTNMFLNKWLSKGFFVAIIAYLIGDLMIYNTMMAKSLREISCTSKQNCSAADRTDFRCWDSVNISRGNVYRLYVLGFVALLLPLIYAGMKKTSSIQVITIILRWLAFFSMVGITIKIFVKGEATGAPHVMNLTSVPKMFGVCIYAFMCHHSVPGIITPIKNKRRLFRGLMFDYILVAGCYVLISLTAIFAFGKLEDVYTLNFQINDCPSATGANGTDHNPGNIPGFDIFLPTYPIFTLFSSYTMIAISLINNMKVLARDIKYINVDSRWVAIAFPLIAMLPALSVSVLVENVAFIVSFVGSYFGGFIQYVFPSLLAYYSRKCVKEQYLVPYVQSRLPAANAAGFDVDDLYLTLNGFASPFQSNIWLLITAVWSVLSVILVTVDRIASA